MAAVADSQQNIEYSVEFMPIHLEALKRIAKIVGTPDDEAYALHYAVIMARDILEDIRKGNLVLVEDRWTGRTERITI